MSSAKLNRVIACKKQNLIDMILDIEKYKEFVPWCLDSVIHESKDLGENIEIKADLKVGKKFLNETYSSLVLYSKKKKFNISDKFRWPFKILKK